MDGTLEAVNQNLGGEEEVGFLKDLALQDYGSEEISTDWEYGSSQVWDSRF